MIETFPIPIEDLIQDPSLTELDLEDQLNLETEDVDSADAARRKALFQNNFLLNDAVLPENPIKISRAQLEVLYDKVKHFPTNKKCLTGLLIYFSIKIYQKKFKRPKQEFFNKKENPFPTKKNCFTVFFFLFPRKIKKKTCKTFFVGRE